MPRILKRVQRLNRKNLTSGRPDGQVTLWQTQGPIIHPRPSRLPGFYEPWGLGYFPEHHSEFIDTCHCPSQLFFFALEGSLVLTQPLLPSQENAAHPAFSPQLVGREELRGQQACPRQPGAPSTCRGQGRGRQPGAKSRNQPSA